MVYFPLYDTSLLVLITAGYVEDQPEIGTFTYRLKGFNKAPVDHYGRSFYLAAESHWRHEKRCLGSVECHKV